MLSNTLFLALASNAEAAQSVANSTVLSPEALTAIIANIATALALIVACYQLYQSNRQHRENAKRCAAEKAIDIAKLFQASIIPKMTYITLVLGLIGQAESYEKSPKLHDYHLKFTKEELVALFGKDAIEAYRQQQEEILPLLLNFAKGDTDCLFSNSTWETNSEELKQVRDRILKYKSQKEFEEQRSDLLNTLEWVAMLINTRVASEETIYQSLHQMFLKYVRLEYPTIAQYNSDYCASDQYYTNIILLYRRWEKRWQLANKNDLKLKQKSEDDQLRRQQRHQKRRDGNVNYAPKV